MASSAPSQEQRVSHPFRNIGGGEGERLRQHYLETGHLSDGPKWIKEEEWVCLTFKKIEIQ